jgi:leucine dehydrogenase
MFSHPDYDGHEALLFAQDAACGPRALIAIHDTTLGPAFGGCRMYPYVSEQHAMTDALRLSRGMTYKACGRRRAIPQGRRKPRSKLCPRPRSACSRPYALPRRSASAAATWMGCESPDRDLGNVGMPLCGYLRAAGAALVVSDLDANRCAQAAAIHGATVAAPEEIHAQYLDVFAPAALGAVLNDATIPYLRCRIVCGGANNQLAETRRWRRVASCSCRTIWRMPAA